MKKFTALFLSVMYLWFTVISVPALENNSDNEFKIPEVKAYVLAEASTGKILLQKNANDSLPMASVTKIMLLLILAEELNKGKVSFEDMVPVSAYASSMEGSVIWLEPGEIMSLHDLVKSVVISSANDATVAVAEYLSGSEEEFVKRMNTRAGELNMTKTHFKNCVGFDDDEHYTSAYDVALMTAALFKYDIYSEFMMTRLSSVRTGTERETQLLNTNKLANYYTGILGGKTGTTDNAGYCLSECAERNGMRVISVVLGAKNEDGRVNLSEYLLDKGFSDYQMFTPEVDYMTLAPISVEGGVKRTAEIELIRLPKCVIEKGTSSKIQYSYSLPESVSAPVKRGDVIGKVTATIGNEIVFESDLAVNENVDKLTLLKSLSFLFKCFFKY